MTLNLGWSKETECKREAGRLEGGIHRLVSRALRRGRFEQATQADSSSCGPVLYKLFLDGKTEAHGPFCSFVVPSAGRGKGGLWSRHGAGGGGAAGRRGKVEAGVGAAETKQGRGLFISSRPCLQAELDQMTAACS